MERRPTKKYKRRENKKFPYRKHRKSGCTLQAIYETLTKNNKKSPLKLKKKLHLSR